MPLVALEAQWHLMINNCLRIHFERATASGETPTLDEPMVWRHHSLSNSVSFAAVQPTTLQNHFYQRLNLLCWYSVMCISLSDVCLFLRLCVPLINPTVCPSRQMYWQAAVIFYSLATRLMQTLITWPELPSALVSRKSIDPQLSEFYWWFLS